MIKAYTKKKNLDYFMVIQKEKLSNPRSNIFISQRFTQLNSPDRKIQPSVTL